MGDAHGLEVKAHYGILRHDGLISFAPTLEDIAMGRPLRHYWPAILQLCATSASIAHNASRSPSFKLCFGFRP